MPLSYCEIFNTTAIAFWTTLIELCIKFCQVKILAPKCTSFLLCSKQVQQSYWYLFKTF